MKYFTIKIQTNPDGTHSCAIVEANGEDNAGYINAQMELHSELAYAMNAKTLKKDTVLIVNEDGVIYKTEVFNNETNEGVE